MAAAPTRASKPATAPPTVCSYAPSGQGYLQATAAGDVLAGGTARLEGTLMDQTITKPVVGLASTPTGDGYWEAASDGGVFAFGDAAFRGSMGGKPLTRPVVGMAATPDGGGYWLVASDGGIFAFGDAVFHGSMGGKPLAEPVVGMAATPDGGGYWLVASDGGVFAFGDAVFHGSMGGKPLTRPVVGMATTPDGGGYWLVASDGGVFAFGDAVFYGSMGGTPLARPVTGMAASPSGDGYWLSAADAGIFSFGDASFEGSFAGGPLPSAVVGIAAVPAGAMAASPVSVDTLGSPSTINGADYYYAGAEQRVPTEGAAVQMCAAEAAPSTGTTDDHTLTELAVEDDSQQDYLEIGWIASPDEYGSLRPMLFVDRWTNGTFFVCNSRTIASCGYVQVSPFVAPNTPVPLGVTTSYAVEQADGRWDLYYDGELMGYFPDALWNGTFTGGQLVQIYGEVDTASGNTPSLIMGNGISGDQPGADRVSGYELLGAHAAAAGFDDAYDSVLASYDVAGATTTSFSYGGSGGSRGSERKGTVRSGPTGGWTPAP